ncbi:SGNH/GDSL hydrolase family protein [Echinicola rosea]|uniref:SGNH/GDSL hydrolase family protein n=1 Tax=Echinicola rosea TaxID=1807691 RepID=UPI0010CA922E|nr:SGNH/GDSL hydrolase family protein [Echinicola rosea]
MLLISASCDEETPPQKRINKVLVIGNSITYHPPAPDIGWNNSWGMAASSPEKDYFSILKKSLENHNPNVQVIRENVYPFEVYFSSLDYAEYADLKGFGADMVIVRLGENVNTDQVKDHNFGEALISFVNYLKKDQESKVVVSTTFWPNPVMNEQLRWAANKENWFLIDITYLSEDDVNMALGEYENEGVARHPGDTGMMEIARLIREGLPL